MWPFFDQLSSALALKIGYTIADTHTHTHLCVKGGSPGAGRLISGALDNNSVL